MLPFGRKMKGLPRDGFGGKGGRLGMPELSKYLLLDLMEVRVPVFLMIHLMKHMEHQMYSHCVAAA